MKLPYLFLFIFLGSICSALDIEYALSRHDITAVAGVGSEIWVATFDGGVVCLDGQLLVVRELTAGEGLPSVHATSLAADEAGGLWIGTIGGPAHWEEKGKLECPETIAGLHTSDTNSITKVGDRIWFATNEGARLFDPKYAGKPAWDRSPALAELEPVMDKQWGKVPWLLTQDKKTGTMIPKPTWLYLITPANTVLDDLYTVCADGESVWFGGVGKVFRYSYPLDRWQTFPLPASYETRFITALLPQGNDLYLGTDAGLFILKDKDSSQAHVSLSSFPLWEVNILVWQEDKALVGSNHGVYRYTPFEDSYYCLSLLPPDARRVTALYKCDRGWLVGSDAGLWLYPKLGGAEKPVRIALGDELPRSDVWALAPADTGVFLGTGKGLSLWRDGENTPQNITGSGLEDGVFAMLRDKNDLWLAKRSGLGKLDLSDRKNNCLEIKGLTQKKIRVLAVKEGGGVWAASENIIFPVESNNAINRAFFLPPTAERVTSLWQDGAYLYAATWGMGVVKLDAATGRLVGIYDDSYSLGSNLVYNIKPTIPNRLTVCEQDAGLDVIDLDNGEPVDHINSSDGLSHTDILSLLEEPGELWVSVRGVGLNILDKSNRQVTVINSRKGLGDSYIKDFLRSGDYIYLATAGGAVRFNSPRQAGIVEFWGKEKPVETAKLKGKHIAKEASFEVPGMPETKTATPASPVKINLQEGLGH